jgi:hypothetical protein
MPMSFGRVMQSLTVTVGAIPLVLAGCATRPDVLPVAPTDLQAIRNIYDASGAIFHGSQIDIEVQSGGTVELEMRGQVAARLPITAVSAVMDDVLRESNARPKSLGLPATQPPQPDSELTARTNTWAPVFAEPISTDNPKLVSDADSSPTDSDGDVWIPILLMRKLPYFQLVPPSNLSKVSLEAYEFRGGLWCIAAVVKRDTSATSSPPSSTTSSTDFLDFRVVLAGSPFTETLPFVIPSGQTAESVAISISLPKGARFSSANGAITMRNMRDWRQRGTLRSEVSAIPQALTSIPSAVTGNNAREAVTLYSPDAVGWDFSEVKFTQPGFLSRYKPWFLPSIVLLACGGIGLSLILARSSAVNSNLVQVHERGWMEVYSLGRSALDAMSRLTPEVLREFNEVSPGSLASWRRVLEDVLLRTGNNREDYKYQEYGAKLYDIQKLLDETSYFLRNAGVKHDFYPVAGTQIDHFLWQVHGLKVALENAVRRERQLSRGRATKRSLTVALWAIGVLAFICMVFVISFLAQAQSLPQSTRHRSIPLAMLCDLDITLTPRDPQTTPGNQVDVALRFSPLTGVRKQKAATLLIGTGDRMSISIEDPAVPTDKNLSVMQHSHRLITLGFPTTYSSIFTRIGALSGLLEGYKIPDDYPQALANASQFNFSYTLRGAEAKHERVSGQSHWLYMFPFDTVDVDIPIDVRQDSLLLHLELQKPSEDMFTTPSVEGLPVSLSESENGDKYGFVSPDAKSRTAVTPLQRIIVHGRFQRTSFQRWGLTFGVWVLAIVVGAVAGFATILPDKHWIGYTIGLLGITGLVLGVRNTVLSTYKWLPTLMNAQGTSIFELFFVVSLVLLVLSIWVTRKLLKA